MAIRPGGKNEVNQTHVAWTQNKGVPGVPSPLYYNGRLYTVQNGGIIFSRQFALGGALPKEIVNITFAGPEDIFEADSLVQAIQK